MRTTIELQVQRLAENKNTNAIKAWWNGLSNTQKALAISAIAGLSWGAIAYFTTVGSISAVVTNGIVTKGAAITAQQALWTGTVAAIFMGGATYTIAKPIIVKQSLRNNFVEAEEYSI